MPTYSVVINVFKFIIIFEYNMLWHPIRWVNSLPKHVVGQSSQYNGSLHCTGISCFCGA